MRSRSWEQIVHRLTGITPAEQRRRNAERARQREAIQAWWQPIPAPLRANLASPPEDTAPEPGGLASAKVKREADVWSDPIRAAELLGAWSEWNTRGMCVAREMRRREAADPPFVLASGRVLTRAPLLQEGA